MMKFLSKLFGSKNDREINKLKPLITHINAMEESFKGMSTEELKAVTPRFKEKLDNGASLDDILPAAFAAVRETGRRVMEMRHYDVQMVGGIFLHRGNIAEMKTGEGKTLVATLPVYLNALSGKGVHLVTVNDYLATRDAEWMAQIYNFLGLSVGTIVADMTDTDRKNAYNCDITYGTNNEFGFDYLRDNMKYSIDRKAQRELNFAIVDEVDSILIDEARTPLIISGRADQSTDLYFSINKIIPFLKKDEDYIADEESRSVTLTDEGVEQVEKKLKLTNLYEPTNIEYLHHVNKALQAHTLYKKDVSYIVDGGEVIIVDEHTGRPMPGRRWSDGLHQAVEAKEGVSIRDENHTLATITFQNFFRMYNKLAGMTGTAETEAEEFKDIYKLDCFVVPTNRPIARLDMNDVIYKTEREKFRSICDQILECHAKGQPVLVGTVSVEKSDAISKVLKRKKIKHSVLNAKFHRREADIVAQAGRKGAITIATNMAGRGTDILLGGNAEALAKDDVGVDIGPEFEAKLEVYKAQCAREKKEVLDAGGLFILGTERHESRRIDNQLRGRAGRQGDPGGARFFLSLEDDLLRIFGADRITFIMDKLDMPEGEPIEANMVSKSIENAQRRVEGKNFDIRKNLLEYDDVMNQQRKTIYEMRDKVLEGGEPLHDMTLDVFDRAAVALLENFCPEKVRSDDWDIEGMKAGIKERFNVEVNFEDANRRDQIGQRLWSSIEAMVAEKISDLQYIADKSNEAFGELEEYEEKSGKTIFLELIHNTYLKAIDFHWREHLKSMDALKDAIRFHGYAQKDPKKIYKIEGYDCFERTMLAIDNQVVEYLTRIFVAREETTDEDIPPGAILIRAIEMAPPEEPEEEVIEEAPAAPADTAMPAAMPTAMPAAMPTAMPTALNRLEPKEASGDSNVRRVLPKIGRNDKCPCGSGKKFKRCHMGNEEALSALLA